MYYDSKGDLWMGATIAGRFPWMSMKTSYQMENALYRGEQMHSFDAVFGGRNSNGQTENLVNNETGAIDQAVFSHWKKYDISAYVLNNWQNMKDNLSGKIRISVGNQDNFLLDKSVKLMEKKMKTLNIPIQFAYYSGDHFTVHTPEYRKDGYQFLKEKYLEWQQKNKSK